MLFLAVLGLFLLSLTQSGLIGGDGMDLVETPHGFRPAKCIHRHTESPVEITEHSNGTMVYFPKSNRREFYPLDEDCVRNAMELAKTRRTDGGLQAWEDYASYTPPSQMGNFTSTYQIPNESPASDRQLLYYFIGFQNNGGAGVTIVQPVVNYCGNCGQYPNGWSMEPWNCCPSGQTHTGKNIKLAPGVETPAWVYADNTNVVIGMSYNNEPTVLTVRANNRKMNWCCATLEIYGGDCSHYNKQGFNCSQMALTTLEGKSITPNWRTTGEASCRGGVVVYEPSNVGIFGQDKP